ncbi:DMRT E-like protein [Dinothrombium tinctorium]|uniref:DMRT E-like protein n=1 Tax=Dinothrombium tinctorium TaxID=1965070 RepID=A0A443R5H3_9ACAR|nr:DMRT E-like protein [Dinothrombium tinctorium]
MPKCVHCFNHGIVVDARGHRYECLYTNCSCNACVATRNKRQLMATRVAELKKQRNKAEI